MTFDADAGNRLREERKRLGWTQQEAAAHCDIDQTIWSRYERNDAAPNGNVLAALAKAGGDVHYVLTGIKGNALPTPDEQALLADYRALDNRDKLNQRWIGAVMRMNASASGPAATPVDVPRAMRMLEVFLASTKEDKEMIDVAVAVAAAHLGRSTGS